MTLCDFIITELLEVHISLDRRASLRKGWPWSQKGSEPLVKGMCSIWLTPASERSSDLIKDLQSLYVKLTSPCTTEMKFQVRGHLKSPWQLLQDHSSGSLKVTQTSEGGKTQIHASIKLTTS